MDVELGKLIKSEVKELAGQEGSCLFRVRHDIYEGEIYYWKLGIKRSTLVEVMSDETTGKLQRLVVYSPE